jgi:hypothetical protein
MNTPDPQIEICIASAYCPHGICSCPPVVAPAMGTAAMLLTAALLLALAWRQLRARATHSDA